MVGILRQKNKSKIEAIERDTIAAASFATAGTGRMS
jgi:hypothetical protein